MGEGTSRQSETEIDLPALGREVIERYIRENIKTADQRAMFFLVASVVILAFLITRNAPMAWFYGPKLWLFRDLVSLASVMGLTASATLMLSVLNPNRKGASLAIICREKYRALRWGFRIGAVAAFLALFYLILATRSHHVVYHRY